MCIITKDDVERIFIPGNELPANGGLWGSKTVKGEGRREADLVAA